jgi:hypothetical protein
MKRILLRCLAVLSGALLMLGTAGIGPARAANNVGGLDIAKACFTAGNKQTYRTVGTTAYDWRCVNLDGALVGLNLTSACHFQHGSDSIDRIGNFYDINSVQCWHVVNLAPVGGLDLDRYCRDNHSVRATAVGSTAYDWRCVDSHGVLTGIYTPRACQDLYGGTAIDRFRNFYDRNSWECYV